MRIPVLTLMVLFLIVPFAYGEPVPVIENPREAPVTNAIQYEEVWRTGAEEEEEEFVFGGHR